MKTFVGLSMIGIMAVCTGCVGLIDKTGHVLDGSAFTETVLAVYRTEEEGKRNLEVKQVRTKDGQEGLLITLEDVPVLQLRTAAGNVTGNFLLTDVRFLAGNYTGWNEFTLDLSGSGTFTLQGWSTGILQIRKPIDAVQISKGNILHNGSRLTGDQALTQLRNRYERIKALTAWMHTVPGVPGFETQDAFEVYWKPLLMPELVSNRKRPAGFAAENAVWVRAEDVRWNTAYTESFFPEELWTLRNSGSLLRDWEEALAWIYVQYQWDYIMGRISEQYTLKKIK
jgi:hypothetical protein